MEKQFKGQKGLGLGGQTRDRNRGGGIKNLKNTSSTINRGGVKREKKILWMR